MKRYVLIFCWIMCLPAFAQNSESSNDFFQTHHLIFFYSSACPHCHNVSPYLKKWADAHHAVVQAYAFDNQALPEFPRFLSASQDLVDVAFEGRAIEYPALYILNAKTHQLYPVVIGEFTDLQLEMRMQDLVQKIMRYEGA